MEEQVPPVATDPDAFGSEALRLPSGAEIDVSTLIFQLGLSAQLAEDMDATFEGWTRELEGYKRRVLQLGDAVAHARKKQARRKPPAKKKGARS